jgi:hypothetical protein
MIVCKIVDSLNRTESLYHGLGVSPDESDYWKYDFDDRHLSGNRVNQALTSAKFQIITAEQTGELQLPKSS